MFSLKANILSQTQGRIRIGCLQLHTAHVDSWVKHILEVPGVLTASINKKAGTMLVTYDPKTIDYPVFNMVFNHQVEKQLKRDINAFEHFTYTPPPKKETTDVLKKRKVQRKLRRFENRNMVVSGITLLAGIATRNWYLHAFGGWWFTAAALAHSWRYRKTIWR